MKLAGTLLAIVLAGCSVRESIPLGSLDGAVMPDVSTVAPSCPQTFTPCGGDLTGTWQLSQFCGTQPAANICATAQTTITFTGTETTSFDTGSMVTTKMDTYIYVTDASSCLDSVTTCATIAAKVPTETCAPSATSSCACTMSLPVTSSSTYTYGVQGSVLTFSQPGMSYAAEFCVHGNALEVSLAAATPIIEVYQRQ